MLVLEEASVTTHSSGYTMTCGQFEASSNYYAHAQSAQARKRTRSTAGDFFSSPDKAQRDAWAQRWVVNHEATQTLMAERRAEAKAKRGAQSAELLAGMEVGTLLHYSWGYDQTQGEFFQVVKIVGKASVSIRPIAGFRVVGSEGHDCCRMTPAKDSFTGKATTKKVGPYGCKMAHGSASPTAADKSHYCSWYA